MVSELEPHKRAKKELAPRHIPQVVVPIPISEVREFVREALTGTSILNPIARYYAGWMLFSPRLRFTEVDSTHSRIEIDVVGAFRGAETLFFVQRRGEIDRFFVAIQDELDHRARWLPPTTPE